MTLKVKNSRFLDRVELLVKVAGTDDLGYPASEVQSIGFYAANVEQLSGGRALYFQSLGYTHPLIVKMYDPQTSFSQIIWNGSIAAIRTVTTDKSNTDCITIYADLKTDHP